MAQEDTLETDGCAVYTPSEVFYQQSLESIKVPDSAPRTPIPPDPRPNGHTRTPSTCTSISSISDGSDLVQDSCAISWEDTQRAEFLNELVNPDGAVQTYEVPGLDPGVLVVPPSPNPATQNVSFQNCSDVKYGNTTHFNGPVIIHQYQQTNNGGFQKSKESLYPGKMHYFSQLFHRFTFIFF